MKPVRALLFSALTGVSLCASSSYGLGLQTGFDLGDGSVIAPKLDYLHLTDSSSVAGSAASIDLSTTADVASLAADYDYFINGQHPWGFYGAAGLGVAVANIHVDGSTFGASASTTSHQTVVYPEIGAGYLFQHYFGVELMYKNLRLSDVTVAVGGVPAGYSYSGTLQLAFVVRF
jgi:hypothetical protein